MRTLILAATAALTLAAAQTARADEFTGGGAFDADTQDRGAAAAYIDRQAANAQASDPTAPNSVRSHGRP